VFSGSLILASGSTFEILATCLSWNAAWDEAGPHMLNIWWNYGFVGVQVLILVLLVTRSGISTRFKTFGSLILASCATFEILVAYFCRSATSPYMSRDWWSYAFAGAEILILVLLTALSGMSAWLKLRFFQAHRA